MERDRLKRIFAEILSSHGFKQTRVKCYKSCKDFLIVAQLAKLPYRDSYTPLYGFCIRQLSDSLPCPSAEDCVLVNGGSFRLTEFLGEIPYREINEAQVREILQKDIEENLLPVERLGFDYFLQRPELETLSAEKAYLYMQSKFPKPAELTAAVKPGALKRLLSGVLHECGFNTFSDEIWKNELRGHTKNPNLYYLQKGDFVFKSIICKGDGDDYYIRFKITDLSLTWPASRKFYPDALLDDLQPCLYHITCGNDGLNEQELKDTLKSGFDEIIGSVGAQGRDYLISRKDWRPAMEGAMTFGCGIATKIIPAAKLPYINELLKIEQIY